jgi:hypothetical protein
MRRITLNRQVTNKRAMLTKNFRDLYSAMYSEPLQKSDKLLDKVMWKERHVTLIDAFLTEIKRLLQGDAIRGGRNWGIIIILFYGINAENPRRWKDYEIAKKCNIKRGSIEIQKKVALEHLSYSELLRQFLI